MSKRHRFLFLGILAVLFSIIAPVIIFFSLGWRIDFKTGKITQPGILYFKVTPRNCQIFIDGKLRKKTDFIFGSVLVDNLPAKKYGVEIKKEGFYSWKKTLEVNDGQPTEAKNIVLVPENIFFNTLAKNIERVFQTPNEKTIIFVERNNQTWSLKLYDLEKNLKSALFDEKDFVSKAGLDYAKNKAEILNMGFSNDSSSAQIEIKISAINQGEGENSKTFFYILSFSNDRPIFYRIHTEDTDAEKIRLNPADDSKIFILGRSGQENNLGLFDAETKKEIISIGEKIIDFSISGSDIYYLDSSGLIYQTDLSLAKRDRINSFAFPLKDGSNYNIYAYGSRIFIKENDSLYYYGKVKDNFEKIADDISGFKISPDINRLVFYNAYEIWVFFLEKEADQPISDAGSKIFITRFSDKIGSVFWYTNYYLAFNSGDNIKISEIDNRDNLNIVDLASYKNPEIFWSQFDKKLYILSEGSLFVSNKAMQ